MLVNRRVAARQCASPAHRLDLQGEGQKADRVVRVDRALELKRENQVQIAAAPKHKGIAPLRRHGLKTAAEVQFDHFTGGRFRHGTKFLRWRPDKKPAECAIAQVQRENRSALNLL